MPNATSAIRYPVQFAKAVPDPSTRDVRETAEVVAALKGPEGLTAEDRGQIGAIRQEPETRLCHRCDYCQPCPREIAIPTVLSVRSSLRRFPLERAFGEGMAAARKALDCADCGECETRCPYHLPIREMLAQHAVFYLAEKRRYDATPWAY